MFMYVYIFIYVHINMCEYKYIKLFIFSILSSKPKSKEVFQFISKGKDCFALWSLQSIFLST